MTLYAASSDGTIAVFDFDPEELDGITPHSVQEQYLKKFGFVPPPIPEGYSHDIPSLAPNLSSSTRITPPPSPDRAQDQAAPSQAQNGFGHSVNGTGERVNMLVAKRKGPKRIQPTLASSIPSASIKDQVVVDTTPASASAPRSFATDLKSAAFCMPSTPRLLSQPPDPAFQLSTADQSSLDANPFSGDAGAASGMDMDVPISSLDQNGPITSVLRGKRKAVDAIDETRTSKPRTLGGDISRGTTIVRELAGRTASATTSRLWAEPQVDVLPRPPLLTFLSVKVEGSDDVLEVRNPENEGKLRFHLASSFLAYSSTGQPEVLLTSSKGIQFVDYLPSLAVGSVLTSSFCAVAMIDGCVNVYSLTGRRCGTSASLSLFPLFAKLCIG